MPMPRKAGVGRRGWTDDHKAALLGPDFFHVFLTDRPVCWGPFRDRPGGVAYRLRDSEEERENERKAECWKELRDELLPIWISEKPFTRPDIWWKVDAPAPGLRLCLSGVHPFELPDFIAHCEANEPKYPGYTARTKKTVCGKPCIQGPPGLPFGGGPKYETERAYLARLNLLTNHERDTTAS